MIFGVTLWLVKEVCCIDSIGEIVCVSLPTLEIPGIEEDGVEKPYGASASITFSNWILSVILFLIPTGAWSWNISSTFVINLGVLM